MQKLLDKEIELEAELQRCQDNLDLFEEYYLQTSWRAGNIFLGWPICSYTDITEFINRPRARKTAKAYVDVAEHEKIFSLSSVSSRPFINVSKVNYLATKDLHLEGRQRIPRAGNQSKRIKPNGERLQKLDKIDIESGLKDEEDQEEDEMSQEESGSEESEGPDIENSESKYMKVEDSDEEESEIESESKDESPSENDEESAESEESSDKIIEEKVKAIASTKRNQASSTSKTQKKVSYNYRNQKRAITVNSESSSR